MLTRGTESKSRWLDVLPVRITALDARGPGLGGPTAIGAFGRRSDRARRLGDRSTRDRAGRDQAARDR
jgi:hypothetical protein